MAASEPLCKQEAVELLELKDWDERGIDLHLGKLAQTIKSRISVDVEGRGFSTSALQIASSLLNEFCTLNWTGPEPLEPACERFGWKVTPLQWKSLNKSSLDYLSMDGEMFYPLTKEPMLLLLSKCILLSLCDGTKPRSQECALWLMRCLYIHQKLLDERVHSLWESLDAILSNDMEVAISDDSLSFTREKKVEILLEMGTIALYYLQYDRAEDYFSKAQKMANLDINLTGALGRRTKFQTTDLAQLVLNVVSDRTPESETPPQLSRNEPFNLPKDVQLNDDTILENIHFSSQEPGVGIPTSALDQAVVLSKCVLLKRTTPKDRLRLEELEAYIRSVLECPLEYGVQFMALFLRSVLQNHRRVMVERSMLQVQELVSQYAKIKDQSIDKMLFYCVDLPPHWLVERELANQLVSLGCVSSALEVFERLQLWEDVITCCQTIGRSGKAESIIREQLQVKETPTLWCLLGDVTKNGQYYEKAWELSGYRSSRAQRSLGMLHLRNKEYAECIECLRKSTSINFLQEGVWFSMGYAANQIADYNTAVESFRNCVTLEPDNGEAWNNLAAIYIKRNNKHKAYLILQESLKRNFESWKVWENYLVVCIDIGAFKDVITASHRLMDLKDKYYDTEILGHLVRAVIEGMMDNNDHKASLLRKDVGELLGRIVSKVSTDPQIWKLYSKLHLSSSTSEDHRKGLAELQKAQRLSRQSEGWENDEEKLMNVFRLTVEYCRVSRQVCEEEVTADCKQVLSSARLASTSILAKMKNFQTVSGTIPIPISDGILELESELTALKNLLQTLQ